MTDIHHSGLERALGISMTIYAHENEYKCYVLLKNK